MPTGERDAPEIGTVLHTMLISTGPEGQYDGGYGKDVTEVEALLGMAQFLGGKDSRSLEHYARCSYQELSKIDRQQIIGRLVLSGAHEKAAVLLHLDKDGLINGLNQEDSTQ